jgi:hypothetical protein
MPVNLYGTNKEFYEPTANDYVIGRRPMTCGSAEAESRKYHKHVGKSGKIWLIADQPNSADHIYVEGGPNSDGFGGRELTFPLVDGTEIKLRGPWHSNGQAFVDDTGLSEILDKYYTIVIIGKEVKYGKHYETIVKDVLYKNTNWVLGPFHRGDILGREYAQMLGHKVFVVDITQGGGSHRYVEPDTKFYWEKENKPVISSDQQAKIIMS